MSNRDAMFSIGALALGYALYRMLTLEDNENAVRRRISRGYAGDYDVFNGSYALPQNHEPENIEPRFARKWLH